MFNFFKKIYKINNKQKGITLVIAMTTITLLLSISLSISNIVLRQIKITNLNNSSKPAFFVADSAMECAMYHDTMVIASSTDPSIDLNKDFSTALFGASSTVKSLKASIKCGQNLTKVVVDHTNSALSVNTFDIGYDNFCARVTVKKTDVDTEIVSRGYNTKLLTGDSGCDLSNIDSRRLVERGLTIKY